MQSLSHSLSQFTSNRSDFPSGISEISRCLSRCLSKSPQSLSVLFGEDTCPAFKSKHETHATGRGNRSNKLGVIVF